MSFSDFIEKALFLWFPPISFIKYQILCKVNTYVLWKYHCVLWIQESRKSERRENASESEWRRFWRVCRRRSSPSWRTPATLHAFSNSSNVHLHVHVYTRLIQLPVISLALLLIICRHVECLYLDCINLI